MFVLDIKFPDADVYKLETHQNNTSFKLALFTFSTSFKAFRTSCIEQDLAQWLSTIKDEGRAHQYDGLIGRLSRMLIPGDYVRTNLKDVKLSIPVTDPRDCEGIRQLFAEEAGLVVGGVPYIRTHSVCNKVRSFSYIDVLDRSALAVTRTGAATDISYDLLRASLCRIITI